MEHKMCFVGEWTFVILKPGIDFAQLFVRGKLARLLMR
jgi:hypothetical protein